MSDCIIFDLDGVITSEEAYWDSAGLVLHELLYGPRYWNIAQSREPYQPPQTGRASRHAARTVLPEAAIVGFKARSINSNWDTCYTGVSLSLIHLLARVPDLHALLPLRPEEDDWIAALRAQLAHVGPVQHDLAVLAPFAAPVFEGHLGIGLIERLNAYASQVLGTPIEHVFARYSPSWRFCQDLFQEWYLGETLYARTYGRAPAQAGKPGCIHFEEPLLPAERMAAALKALREQGYTLGIATGRPRQESFLPLEQYGVFQYFERDHVTTQDEAALAETELRARGEQTSLMKPHPYQFLLAADPTYDILHPAERRPAHNSFLVVGDSTSDILGGHAAGAITIAVLTGARTQEARTLLEQSQPDFIVEDMTGVPELVARIDSLATIQRLQFSQRALAERLLQRWFARHMQLRTERVTLVPRAVSLNSFNGFYELEGEEFFFKTHVEEQGVLEEYYHAELLHQAGYNIVRPLRTLHEKDQQMVIYPVVRWPVMFDLMRSAETQGSDSRALVAAEQAECVRLLDIYQKTKATSSAAEHARAPIHQLFWHRLSGGRLHTFYAGKAVPLPQGGTIAFDELCSYHWQINGVAYEQTLGQLIERATHVLDPARASLSVIGHGDAHFGNVFLEDQQRYLYFDPAFAGRHTPLLDIVKPLFHNIFASWMYFPQDVARALHLSVDVRGNTISVEHDYRIAPVRQAILETKLEGLVKPLLAWLRAEQALSPDWQEYLNSALLCCPLLTINLLDETRMPPAIAWLGLQYAVAMGNNGVSLELS